MRICVYLRISEDREGDELGVTRQREDAEELIRRRGWTDEEVVVLVENNTSATRGTRPVWEAMMTDVEAGRVDVVVGWALDRILRTGRDRLRMLQAGKTHGVILLPVRGSEMDLGTTAGSLTADLLGAVAQAETEAKADRQRRAARQRAEAGRSWTSRRPFGYSRSGDELDETEAELVRVAYTEFLAGRPLNQIALAWNEAGVTTTTGRAWSQQTVTQLLRNPRYAGLRTYRGEVVGTAVWPPVVDELTFRRALARFKDPARRTGGGGQVGSLLTGIARCGVCAEQVPPVAATVQKGVRTARAPYYRCARAAHLTRKLHLADEFVIDILLGRFARDDVQALLRDDTPDAARLEDEAEELREELNLAAVDRAEGRITRGQMLTMTERLTAKLELVEKQMIVTDRAELVAPLIGAADLRAAWDALPLHHQRRIVEVFLDVRILPSPRGPRFDPTKIDVSWR